MHKVKEIETAIGYLEDKNGEWMYERELLLMKKKKNNFLEEYDEKTLENLNRKIVVVKEIIENAELELSVTKKMQPEEELEDREIPLAEWARNNNVIPANARQRANRGSFASAHKVGNTWMIKANEPNIGKEQGRKNSK